MVSVSKSAAGERNSNENRLLVNLGDRVRRLRERRGISRKALSDTTGVSERHLANLEYGEGNVSVLVLDQVAGALECSPAELIGDVSTRSSEWLGIRSLLANRDEATLRRVRLAIGQMLGDGDGADVNHRRIALLGLRGAGKSTLGAMLAKRLECPFIELSREVENLAGCSIGEIQALYGQPAFHRYQRRALQEVAAANTAAVVAIPGGLVADSEAFEQLLAHYSTIWLEADPGDHMQRVIAQGDYRPMLGNSEAMDDLVAILESRQPFYSRAGYRLDTSAQNLQQTFTLLAGLAAGIGKADSAAARSGQTEEKTS